MTETLLHVYSYESTQWELSNEYQLDRVKMVFKKCCILVLLVKVSLASEGLNELSITLTKTGRSFQNATFGTISAPDAPRAIFMYKMPQMKYAGTTLATLKATRVDTY